MNEVFRHIGTGNLSSSVQLKSTNYK